MDKSAERPAVIWVVHGRNLEIRDAMFAFLRSIGLKPKEWSQAVNEAAKDTGQASPYIFGTLETVLSKCPVVVVLMTPDDEARLREPYRKADDPPYESDLTGQARPNVLFEAGMAMGVLRDRTILVEIGTMRPFTDIGGMLIVRLDNSSQKRQELAERLRKLGCPVETSGYDWHTAGNFELSSGIANAESAPESMGQSSKPPADEVTILRELGNPKFSRDRTVSSVGESTKMSPEKVRYYLDEMAKRNLVKKTSFYFNPDTYCFTDLGREYAVKNNIL
jgi:predicted nucleotide-binding protein